LETLLLSDDEVKGLLSMEDSIGAVELAFREKALGRVQMPPKLYLFFKKYNGDLRAMPSYLEEMDISAVKVVNVHPENREKYGLPTVMAIIILVDPKNGVPIAIISGKTITDMRTGAAGGVSAKYLARKNPKIVGLVGAGAQARTQLVALLEVYKKFEEVRVWSPGKTKYEFTAEMQPKYGDFCKIISAETVGEAVEGADIVVTTTPSRKPLVMDVWFPLEHISTA
jgi:alanine dehydrogenase